MASLDLQIPLSPPLGGNWNMCAIKASGDGYSGKYRFVRSSEGWTLRGQGGDYLTPGIGVPIYAGSPQALLELILIRRPGIQLRASV